MTYTITIAGSLYDDMADAIGDREMELNPGRPTPPEGLAEMCAAFEAAETVGKGRQWGRQRITIHTLPALRLLRGEVEYRREYNLPQRINPYGCECPRSDVRVAADRALAAIDKLMAAECAA